MKLGDPWAVLEMEDTEMRDYLIVLDLRERGEISTERVPWPPVSRLREEGRPHSQAELAALAASYWAQQAEADPHG